MSRKKGWVVVATITIRDVKRLSRHGARPKVPAFADGNDKGPSFPMPAATFQQHVNARQTKAREHMEKRASQLPADQAKELRAKFEAGIAKVNAEVAKAVADGTVTKEEAAAVRAASPHAGGGGHHCDKGKPGA